MIRSIFCLLLALLICNPVHAVSYQELDRDNDGFINNHEAQEMPELAGQWIATDTNQDGKVDRAEFALFEITLDETLKVGIDR